MKINAAQRLAAAKDDKYVLSELLDGIDVSNVRALAKMAKDLDCGNQATIKDILGSKAVFTTQSLKGDIDDLAFAIKKTVEDMGKQIAKGVKKR